MRNAKTLDKSIRELKVWEKAKNLVNQIYENSNGFQESERFGFTTQIRRCAVSIPSNISEGCGRGTNKDFNYFLSVSPGSSFELETQLI